MKKLSLITTAAIALLTSTLSMSLLADADKQATAAAQQSAKVTLAKAVSIAEQATGGKSTEAEFELEEGVALYEVEIAMADGSEVEVAIDAQSGSILSQETEGADGDDHDHEDDHDDGDHEDGDDGESEDGDKEGGDKN